MAGKKRIVSSYGVTDIYRYIRRNKYMSIGEPIPISNFSRIIQAMNLHLIDKFYKGHDIKLPYRLGSIELRKYIARVEFSKGEIQTNLPVNWKATKELWAEDEESRINKTLVRYEEDFIYKILYNKKGAVYKNKLFYMMVFARAFKRGLKPRIKEEGLDSFKLYD